MLRPLAIVVVITAWAFLRLPTRLVYGLGLMMFAASPVASFVHRQEVADNCIGLAAGLLISGFVLSIFWPEGRASGRAMTFDSSEHRVQG